MNAHDVLLNRLYGQDLDSNEFDQEPIAESPTLNFNEPAPAKKKCTCQLNHEDDDADEFAANYAFSESPSLF